MRKIIDRIEINHSEAVEYNKKIYEYNAAQDMFLAVIKTGVDVNKTVLDEMLKDALSKKISLTEMQDELVSKYIAEKYRENKYQWVLDINRDSIEVFTEE